MRNYITFTSRTGSAIFDFDNQRIIFDRSGSLASAVGLIPMEINMSEVTDIELRQPSFTKLGGFNIIVNGIRYVTKTGDDMTHFAITQKSEFPALEAALRNVLSVCGVGGFKKENSVNARKEEYTGIDPGRVNSIVNAITEHRMRCNVCGQVFCYTDADLRKNQQHARGAMTSSIAGLAGALGGYYAAGATNQQSADQQLARIVDYSRCPNCKSTNLTDISHEEIGGAKAEGENLQVQQKAGNVAEELKQFKELLDMGIITQEEFDAKKKQLLGL